MGIELRIFHPMCCPKRTAFKACVLTTFLLFFFTFIFAQEAPSAADVAYIRDVEKMIGEGNLSDAKQMILLRLSNNEDDGKAYFYLAEIHYCNEKYEDAIQTAETALRYLKEYDSVYIAETHYLKSKAYFELEKYDNVIPEMDLAISIRPFVSDYLVFRGLAYFYLEDYDNSEIDFRNALTYESTNHDALLGIALIKMTSDLYDSALKTVNRVISYDDKYSPAYVIRSTIRLQMGEIEKACDDVIKALEIDDSEEARDLLLILANQYYSQVLSKLESKAKLDSEKWQPYLDLVNSITDTNDIPSDFDVSDFYVEEVYGNDVYQDVLPEPDIDHSQEYKPTEIEQVEPEPTEELFELKYTISNRRHLFNDVKINNLKTRLFYIPSQSGFRITQSQASQLLKLSYFDETSISFPTGDDNASANLKATGKIPIGSVLNLESVIIGDLELTNVRVIVVENEGVAFSMGGTDIPSIIEIEDDAENKKLIIHKSIEDIQTEE